MFTREAVLIAAVAIMLSACAQTRLDPVVVRDVPVTLPQPQPLSLSPVHWTVLTPSTAPAAFSTQASGGSSPLFLGLSGEDYKALSVNMIDINRYMVEQQAIIDGLNQILAARSAAKPSADHPSPSH